MNPFLSIVIPVHNEEKRLLLSLEEIERFFEAQSFPVEVLVVENGSQDRTLQIAEEFAQNRSQFHVLHVKERGKGRAVKQGMLAAQGEYRFMCDADLSMPVSEINRFLPPNLSDFDVAIASREKKGAVRYGEPAYRHIGGRVINTIIRTFALPGLHDTQCGFKCFQAKVAEDLFYHQRMKEWSFDIEILYIARMRGYRIVEIPIPWYYNPESKLNVFQDAVKMILEVLEIRRNASRGYYDRENQDTK